MQSKPAKTKRCAVCREEFMPKRIGLKVSKTCSAACELDYAERNGNKPAKAKPKVKTAAKLKKELWPIFSHHQKLVHSEDGEWCQCYTCDKPLRIGSADCHGGHCLSKAGNPNLYFDERAVKPQCLRCNVHHGGMHYEFNEKLKQEIGLAAWQDMYDNRKAIIKRNAGWYEEKIAYYSAEVKRLRLLRASY